MLYPDTAEVFGLSDARGCDYMTVRRYEELITGHAGDFFFYRMAGDFPNVFPLLNVKYILAGRTLPLNPVLFELVYSKEILIYRFKECLDRALLVFNYEVEPDPAIVRLVLPPKNSTLARFCSSKICPRRRRNLWPDTTSGQIEVDRCA